MRYTAIHDLNELEDYSIFIYSEDDFIVHTFKVELDKDSIVDTLRNSYSRYRYAYNGKEWLLTGLAARYDYGFRMYDPAVGRFLSVDPLAREYPSISTYAFAINTPIQANDPDGKRVYFVAGAGNDKDGWNYTSRFARIWKEKGISGFRRLNVSRGQWLDMAFTALYRDMERDESGKLTKANYRSVVQAVDGILADLQKHPLADGEQLNLAGYSYGSVVQAHVALALADKGVKIDNLILIGSPISDKSDLFNALTQHGKIGKIIRHDIPGDLLSNPPTTEVFRDGAKQNAPKSYGGELGDKGPHFDLARPGKEADEKIGQLGTKLVNEGVK